MSFLQSKQAKENACSYNRSFRHLSLTAHVVKHQVLKSYNNKLHYGNRKKRKQVIKERAQLLRLFLRLRFPFFFKGFLHLSL